MQSSSGGPTVVRLLGEDPLEHKVYFEIVRNDESGEPGGIWYFALSGKNPAQPVRATSLDREAWSPGFNEDKVISIQHRLRPLLPLPILQVDLRNEVLFEDSLGTYDCPPRFGVRTTVQGNRKASWGGWELFGSASVTCTTYAEPRVAVASAYQIERGVIVVLAFRGVPAEGCYEVQRPVYVPNAAVWKR